MLPRFIQRILGTSPKFHTEKRNRRSSELSIEEKHRLVILDTFMKKLNELCVLSRSSVIRDMTGFNCKACFPFDNAYQNTLSMDAFFEGSHVIEKINQFMEHNELRSLYTSLLEMGCVIASDSSHRYMLIERLREELYFADPHAESKSAAPYEYQFAIYNEEVYLSFKYYIFSREQGLQHVNTDRVTSKVG